MRELALGSDGVELLLASVRSANHPKAKAQGGFLLHERSDRDETQAVEGEDMDERRIFELADQPRPNARSVKPLFKRAAQPRVGHRQQRWRSVQRLGKIMPELSRQFCLRAERHPAFA